jgi:hypothetical protein
MWLFTDLHIYRPREHFLIFQIDRIQRFGEDVSQANCFSVVMCSRITILSSTISLKKRWRMSMCLVLLCWTWFFEMLIALMLPQNNVITSCLTLYYVNICFIALMLSQNNVITSCLTLYYVNICFIQSSCVQLPPAAMYSTSAVDNDTQFYFLLNQEIRLFPKEKHSPGVLFLSPALPAQPASQYPTSAGFVLWE